MPWRFVISAWQTSVMAWLIQFRDDWVTTTALVCSRNSSNYTKNHGTKGKLAFWKDGSLIRLVPPHSQSCLGKEGFLTVWEVAVSALHGMHVTCIYSSTNANWNWSSNSFLLLHSEIKAQNRRELIIWIRSSLRTVPDWRHNKRMESLMKTLNTPAPLLTCLQHRLQTEVLEPVIITSKPTHKKVNLTFLKPWKSHSLYASQFFLLPKTDHKDVSPLSFQPHRSIILRADLTWLLPSLSLPRRSRSKSYHPSLLFKIMTADLLRDDSITEAQKPLSVPFTFQYHGMTSSGIAASLLSPLSCWEGKGPGSRQGPVCLGNHVWIFEESSNSIVTPACSSVLAHSQERHRMGQQKWVFKGVSSWDSFCLPGHIPVAGVAGRGEYTAFELHFHRMDFTVLKSSDL